jgi:outer membrane protein assembly factor BamE (lipoprotein component of BamABCDE complex)
MGVVLAGVALCAALAAAGCVPKLRQIDNVKVGMMSSDVEHLMGKPKQVIRGENVDTGKELWIYPEGKVLFENLHVTKVQKAGEEPTITEQVEAQRLKEGR